MFPSIITSTETGDAGAIVVTKPIVDPSPVKVS